MAIGNLPEGADLMDAASVPGVADYVDLITTRLPVDGAPNAFCRNVTIPVEDMGGCAEVYPELVDGGSHDPDFVGEGFPLEGLSAELDDYYLCGVGEHTVTMITTDEDGDFSTCESTVRLCESGEGDCPEELTYDSTDHRHRGPTEGGDHLPMEPVYFGRQRHREDADERQAHDTQRGHRPAGTAEVRGPRVAQLLLDERAGVLQPDERGRQPGRERRVHHREWHEGGAQSARAPSS